MSVNSALSVAGADALASEPNALRLDILQHAGDTINDTGAANAYVVTCAAQITSLVLGQVVKFNADNANGNPGASTLRFTNGAALDETDSITLPDGAALRPGDIAAGQMCIVIFDGTNWQLVNPRRNIQGAVYVVTAGETIAANETVCYDTTENEWMLADANNTARVRARGIALSAGTNGALMLIQTSGIFNAASGTPFTAEAQNYQTDTPGAVSSTPSTTTSIPIGYAPTTSQMVLTFGKKMARGTGTSQSAVGTTTETITIGFRAEYIVLMGSAIPNTLAGDGASGSIQQINGLVVGGLVYYASASIDSAAIADNIAASGGGDSVTLGLSGTVSDTAFGIYTTNTGTPVGSSNIRWLAMGE